ncbi:hypothetical protein ACO22_00262 [Paracoccidioides brasiliensis]|uniref:Uncharacterized protein n=1 Tax=Paracoccidioides brasiliensis TaxID=121759 RepID=A0A1D2JPX7_PARBR|nr:hypothetical protein ACO22_00262 [Paracoccidioides brasiliensis]ODH53801.1 hypothetical protein GX48_00219 [Paracoccidioides brasiliensis]
MALVIGARIWRRCVIFAPAARPLQPCKLSRVTCPNNTEKACRNATLERLEQTCSHRLPRSRREQEDGGGETLPESFSSERQNMAQLGIYYEELKPAAIDNCNDEETSPLFPLTSGTTIETGTGEWTPQRAT